MKKRMVLTLTLAAALAAASGCAGPEKIPAGTAKDETVSSGTQTETETSFDTEETAETEEEEIVEYPERGTEHAGAQVNGEELLAAYRTALSDFMNSHIWPDMLDIDYDGDFGDMSENRFAVTDVDGDGTAELVISFTTASEASKMEYVGGYDPVDKRVYGELWGYPSLTYGTDGIVRENASHNQSMAGDLYWPYLLYRYDASMDAYFEAASVEAWEKSVSATDYNGRAFPDDLDTDGDGLVFLVTENDATTTMDNADYDSWYMKTMGASTELTLPWQAVTAENIDALTVQDAVSGNTLSGAVLP